MKLRFYSDSLRLRLSPADVARLGEGGRALAEVAFDAGSSLTYEVAASPAASGITASFRGGHVRVQVPAAAAARWAQSSQVALQATQDAAGGRTLKILIEKDFECLNPAGNEPGETFFPHPGKLAARDVAHHTE